MRHFAFFSHAESPGPGMFVTMAAHLTLDLAHVRYLGTTWPVAAILDRAGLIRAGRISELSCYLTALSAFSSLKADPWLYISLDTLPNGRSIQ